MEGRSAGRSFEVLYLGRGLFSGPKMKKDRKKFRWNERKFKNRETKRRQGGVLKHDPLRGSTQAKGIVIEKVGIEAKQPNSGIRKAVKISLIRTGNKHSLCSRRWCDFIY